MFSMPQCARTALAACVAPIVSFDIYIESGLGRAVPQPGCGAAGKDPALELNHRLDVRTPLGIGQLVGRVEDGGDARLIAIAAFIVAFVASQGGRGLRNRLDLLKQGRLVVLDLDD